MKIKLGLYAVPFGYGPVSKALAIAKAVSALIDVDWYLVGSGISMEFMLREGLTGNSIKLESIDVNEDVAQHLCNTLDGIIIVMHRPWAERLAPYIPVFFVDSLGFMWNRKDFDCFPNMNLAKSIYVQDIFGAYANMALTCLTKIVPVPPIIDITPTKERNSTNKYIVHLGGLFSPFEAEPLQVYLKGIMSIIRGWNLKDLVVVTSLSAIERFSEHFMGLNITSLQHANFISLLLNSEFTWSCPGLTTLLEMAYLKVNTSPLPPQNYSQLVNLKNMVTYFGDELDDVWHYLNTEYQSIAKGLPEKIGVKVLADFNKTKLFEPSFQSSFANLSLQSLERKSKLPHQLRFSKNGADVIAQDIANHYS